MKSKHPQDVDIESQSVETKPTSNWPSPAWAPFAYIGAMCGAAAAAASGLPVSPILATLKLFGGASAGATFFGVPASFFGAAPSDSSNQDSSIKNERTDESTSLLAVVA
ncbi:MAG: hypothetical protein CMF39_02330 [Legionellaceae bacterium]|nr:hypothetical protein [Legionellaceae bacterium]